MTTVCHATPRLRLAPMTSRDRRFLGRLLQTTPPHAFDEILSPGFHRKIVTGQLLFKRNRLLPVTLLTIRRRRQNDLIGAALLVPQPEQTAKAALILHPRFHNRGYGTEALRALLEYGFEHLTLSHITGEADANNRAALRVMRKAGMKQRYRLKTERSDGSVRVIMGFIAKASNRKTQSRNAK